MTFVDVPGFLPGTAQEYGGIIVHGAKLLIPGGHSIISEGDRVIVVAKSLFLKDLNDILVR